MLILSGLGQREVKQQSSIKNQLFLLLTLIMETLHRKPVAASRGILNLRSGDFAGRDYGTVLSIINNAAAKQVESLHKHTPQSRKVTTRNLYQGLSDMRDFCRISENYPRDALEIILGRFQKADNKSSGANTFSRVAARLSEFPYFPKIVTDLDGTITATPTTYLENIPGSLVGESMLSELGREKFPEIFTAVWRDILIDAPEIFEAAGQFAPTRPGVDKFFRYVNYHGSDVTVLSANFYPFVKSVLRSLPPIPDSRVWAVTPNSIISTDKETVLYHLAQQNPDRPIFYFGDGASDIPALKASSVVAAYFALESSPFANALEREHILYFPYRTFEDNRVILAALLRIVYDTD